MMIMIETIANTCSLFLQGMAVVGSGLLQSYMNLLDIIKRLITAPDTVTYTELILLLTIIAISVWGIISIRLVWLIGKDD